MVSRSFSGQRLAYPRRGGKHEFRLGHWSPLVGAAASGLSASFLSEKTGEKSTPGRLPCHDLELGAEGWPDISQRRRSWQQGSPGAAEKGADLEQASDGRHPCHPWSRNRRPQKREYHESHGQHGSEESSNPPPNRPASHNATRSNTAAPTGRFGLHAQHLALST